VYSTHSTHNTIIHATDLRCGGSQLSCVHYSQPLQQLCKFKSISLQPSAS